jgi:hypothetical protein
MTEAQGAKIIEHLAELQRVQWLQAESINWLFLAVLIVAFFALTGPLRRVR